jgi:hypothetical protein
MTDEQKKIRTGRFCASEISKLMKPKGLGVGGMTYIQEKVAEALTGEQNIPEWEAKSTTWGIEHEDEARQYYEAATGLKLVTCKEVFGTDTLENDLIVGSPDRIVVFPPEAGAMENIGFEIKCPYNSGNHLKNLILTTPEDLLDWKEEYYWQIVAYMYLTGLKSWEYCSYDPRFKGSQRMLILPIPWNETHEKLLISRLSEAKIIFDSFIKKLG